MKNKLLFLAILLLPVWAEAKTLKELITSIRTDIFNPLISTLLTASLAFFFLGMVKYMMKINDPKAHTEGRQVMIWGVIGMFVTVSIWGLVNLLKDTFNLDTNQSSVIQVDANLGGE